MALAFKIVNENGTDLNLSNISHRELVWENTTFMQRPGSKLEIIRPLNDGGCEIIEFEMKRKRIDDKMEFEL